ncbi:MAG: hypothetical protein LBQ34_00595 [Alphaproteobacteria bacterium]|jgi:hypothetical protein|nr:hypothetical protein [Alphaproteobacteria bacterium]
MLNSELFLDMAYIFFSIAMFITIFLCPVIYIVLKLFNYNLKFDYYKFNYIVFFYYLPLGVLLYFFPEAVLTTSGYYMAFFSILILCLYNLPLTYLLNRFVFNKRGLKNFLIIYMIWTSIHLMLIYVLFQVLN